MIFFSKRPPDTDEATYQYSTVVERGFSHLEPNHSHFILVDNAKIEFGGEVDFRAKLEVELSSANQNNKINEIPLVVLVLGGGNFYFLN